MEFKDLAPWLAISITLALSILVPLFTQIANNHHQRKMQQEQFEYEKRRIREEAFRTFLSEVGAVVTADGYIERAQLSTAGGAIHKLYTFAPEEWFADLDQLTQSIVAVNWKSARAIMQKMVRLIAEELKK